MQGYEVVAVTTRAGKTQTGPPQKEKQICDSADPYRGIKRNSGNEKQFAMENR